MADRLFVDNMAFANPFVYGKTPFIVHKHSCGSQAVHKPIAREDAA